MSVDEHEWGEVERRARKHEDLCPIDGLYGGKSKAERQHEASINQVMCAAGLPMVTITCEDRLRGGIISAIAEIEAGHTHLALADLRNCLKL